MTNSWESTPHSGYAIAIGINQYQNFQPLNYAQRDAQALCEFWVRDAEFSPEHVLLFTDASPELQQGYPNRSSILAGLSRICEQAQPRDVLWFFFSGYGVRYQGRDYLMPIEGDPAQLPYTGLAMTDIFAALRSAATDNLFVVLDMCRSQSTLAGEAVGEQTALLASEFGIPTLLSSQPGQFSHETLALRQGLFTAAVLEGLRYQGCLTPEHLTQFLSIRVPELAEHHWRPRQEPIAVIPHDKKYLLLLPGKSATAGAAAGRHEFERSSGAAVLPPPTRSQVGQVGTLPAQRTNQPTMPFEIPTGMTQPDPDQTGYVAASNPSTAVIPVPSPDPLQSPTPPSSSSDSTFWRQVLMWSGLIGALLLLGVLLRNWSEFTKEPSLVTAPAPAPTTPPAEPTPTPQVDSIAPGGGSPVATPAPSPVITETAAPDPTPPPSPPITAVPQTTATNSAAVLAEARAILDRAVASSPNTQVSAFSDAIEKARSIPSSDPLYGQAQQDIDRWSSVILRVAEQRANQGNGGARSRALRNYRSAIAAAELVPRDRQAVYARAQRQIAYWKSKIAELE